MSIGLVSAPLLLGEPSVETVLSDIAELGRPLTLMFTGPTGSGKSSLAYAISTGIADENSRLLKLDRKLFQRLGIERTFQAIQILNPDVVLIDDIQDGVEDILEVLERATVGITVLTCMVDRAVDPTKPGSLYRPGLRPGRVDRIYYVGLPDEQKRRAILLHHTRPREDFESLVKETEGLPSAYLKIAAKQYQGHQDWKSQVQNLKACAPNLSPG